MKDDTDTYKKEEETSNYRSGWTRPLQVSRYTQPTYLPSSCSESNATSWKRETTEVSNNNNEEQQDDVEDDDERLQFIGTLDFNTNTTITTEEYTVLNNEKKKKNAEELKCIHDDNMDDESSLIIAAEEGIIPKEEAETIEKQTLWDDGEDEEHDT